MPDFDFVTGAAGTGKSTYLRNKIDRQRSWGILSCTTGIAAVNVGGTTINSALGYFDTAALLRAYSRGWLHPRLEKLSAHYENLLIDEVSMMERKQLETIFRANSEIPNPMGITLTGDFCQLPPVSGDWAFNAYCWRFFEIRRLGTPHRFADPQFVRALNHARAGNGHATVDLLLQSTALWSDLNENFIGTTIMAKNADVDAFNARRYAAIHKPETVYRAKRWGKQLQEWENIPDCLRLKDGAYVMILTNDSPSFTYANGDCGHVLDCTAGSVCVELNRNGDAAKVGFVTREAEQDWPPPGCSSRSDAGPNGEYYNSAKGVWVVGGIHYMPIRVAYASTVHKSQGLTLDRAQIDIRDQFFGSPNMAYVALSRVRTANGLTIVGNWRMLEERIRIHRDVTQWV